MPCQFNAFVRIFIFLFRTLDLIQQVLFVTVVYTEMQICKMCYDNIMACCLRNKPNIGAVLIWYLHN